MKKTHLLGLVVMLFSVIAFSPGTSANNHDQKAVNMCHVDQYDAVSAVPVTAIAPIAILEPEITVPALPEGRAIAYADVKKGKTESEKNSLKFNRMKNSK